MSRSSVCLQLNSRKMLYLPSTTLGHRRNGGIEESFILYLPRTVGPYCASHGIAGVALDNVICREDPWLRRVPLHCSGTATRSARPLSGNTSTAGGPRRVLILELKSSPYMCWYNDCFLHVWGQGSSSPRWRSSTNVIFSVPTALQLALPDDESHRSRHSHLGLVSFLRK